MLLYALIAFLALIAVGAYPAWPYSRKWGYSPSVGVAFIALLLVVLIFLNVI